jgi:O-antigen/teichoic acid export membrane protein
MSVVQRIAKNAAVLFTAQVGSSLLGLFYTVYTARYLEAEGFGILTFALAFSQLFGVLAELGLNPLTTRQVARDRSQAPKYFANVGAMQLVLAVMTFGVVALTINLMGSPAETIKVVYLVGLSVILTALTHITFSIFQGFEKMEYVSIGRIAHSALLLIGLVPAIQLGFSVVGFAYLYVFASGIVLGMSLVIIAWRFFRSPEWASDAMRIDWSFWMPTLKKSLPFAVSTILISLLHNIDTVMLRTIVANNPNEVVGWYQAAYRLVFMLQYIRIGLSAAVFPVMSQAFITSKESLGLIAERFFKYSLILAMPIGVGTTILAGRFISLVYGAEYTDSVIALQILVWSAVIMYVNFTTNLLHAIEKQVTVSKIIMFSAILNVGLNLLLIPRFSYTGAASATVSCNVVALALALWVFSRTEFAFSLRFALAHLTRVLVASAIMGCFVWYARDLNLAAIVVLAALLYGAILLAMRTLDRTDLHIAMSLLKGEPVLPKLDIDSGADSSQQETTTEDDRGSVS